MYFEQLVGIKDSRYNIIYIGCSKAARWIFENYFEATNKPVCGNQRPDPPVFNGLNKPSIFR